MAKVSTHRLIVRLYIGEKLCRIAHMPKPQLKREAKVGITETSVNALLQKIVDGKTALSVRKGRKIFSQGDPSDAIYFIDTGRVKLSVVSSGGKEAVLAILGPPSFVGEGCMVGQTLRIGSATAVDAVNLFRVDKRAMLYGSFGTA